MGIKTVSYPPYSPDIAPCDFWLFSKLRGCRYETIEEMKEAVTKVIDMLTQEDFHGAFQKLLERYNKCIATGGDYLEGDLSFMFVLSKKVPIRKKSRNLSYAPCMCMLTSLLVDEILLPRYVNESSNFRDLLFSGDMAPSWLKDILWIVSEFTERTIPPAAWFRLFNRDSYGKKRLINCMIVFVEYCLILACFSVKLFSSFII